MEASKNEFVKYVSKAEDLSAAELVKGMNRRCKAGQRARFISGLNKGQIVLVVRPHFEEGFQGWTWPEAVYPWVVTSLSAGLQTRDLDTGKLNPLRRSIIACDLTMEPLKDDDDGLTRSTEMHTVAKGERNVVLVDDLS